LLAGKQQKLFPQNRAFPYSSVFSICALISAWRILPQINAPRNPQVQTNPLPDSPLWSQLFEIARVLVRVDHITSLIAHSNHGMMWAAEKLGVADCVRDWIRLTVPQTTEGERIGNQIGAAFIFARADFVKVRRTLRVAGACEFKYLVAWSG
jgi:hypothetical protein